MLNVCKLKSYPTKAVAIICISDSQIGRNRPLGAIWRDKGMIGGQNNIKGRKRSTIRVPSFPTSYLVEKEISAVALMLSKQKNRLLIHKRGDLRLYATKRLPSFVKAAKRIHYTKLGTVQWYAPISLNKFLNNTCLLYQAWEAKTKCREWKGGDGKKFEKHWSTLTQLSTVLFSLHTKLVPIKLHIVTASGISDVTMNMLHFQSSPDIRNCIYQFSALILFLNFNFKTFI